jgi:hypothetical protein
MEGSVTCPMCSGQGGWTDYWGEYDECSLCKEAGTVTPEQAAAHAAWEAAQDRLVDAMIEREMADERAEVMRDHARLFHSPI